MCMCCLIFTSQLFQLQRKPNKIVFYLANTHAISFALHSIVWALWMAWICSEWVICSEKISTSTHIKGFLFRTLFVWFYCMSWWRVFVCIANEVEIYLIVVIMLHFTRFETDEMRSLHCVSNCSKSTKNPMTVSF